MKNTYERLDPQIKITNTAYKLKIYVRNMNISKTQIGNTLETIVNHNHSSN